MDYIDTYSRAQAIADGVLIDVSTTAQEEGFLCPCAVTDAACAIIEEIWDEASSRLRAVLGVLFLEICLTVDDINVFQFKVKMTRLGSEKLEWVSFKAICGPGDNAELVLTIMLPEED